ncbi:hypothetical protein L1987_78165 [Smallanthus sonchifolius]|uniref:Uncharacterized protein n=1 Tax=Smallanthus sonchifolius TaxID=185202 RepID=A0ACB8ZCF9_9ASTR|nr:hypothetical protein L1987_78165 [Smallanthus sonchifolius]
MRVVQPALHLTFDHVLSHLIPPLRILTFFPFSSLCARVCAQRVRGGISLAGDRYRCNQAERTASTSEDGYGEDGHPRW